MLVPRHDTVVVEQLPGMDIGVLQVFPSPWNPERAILAATGTSDESVEWSLEALTSSYKSLAGILVVVDEDRIPYEVELSEDYAWAASPPENDVVRVGEDRESLLSLVEKWW